MRPREVFDLPGLFYKTAGFLQIESEVPEMPTHIKMTGVTFVGNQRGGMVVHGDGFTIDMVDTIFDGNAGPGLEVKDPSALLIEKLSLPPDVDRAELRALLSSMAEARPEERQSLAASSGFLPGWAKRGLDVTTLAANIVAISAHPMIQRILGAL